MHDGTTTMVDEVTNILEMNKWKSFFTCDQVLIEGII
jgi:hypothetical protein